jgi:hypothetical protein
MNCEEVLYSGKDNAECFLDLSHYLRFKAALAIKVNSFKVDNFLYIETSDPNKDFIVGIDEKIFVKSVLKDCVKFEKDIRRCFGFDYMYNDNFEVRDGVKIYFPGIIMEVLKVFENEKEVRDYIINNEIVQYEGKDYSMQFGMHFSNPYEEFTEKMEDKEIDELKLLSISYTEIKNILDREMEENPKLEELFRNIESEIIEISARNNIPLERGFSTKLRSEESIAEDEEHIEQEINEPINLNSLLTRLKAKKVIERKDEFLNFLFSKKGNVSVKLGNSEISANGILMDKFEDKNITLLVLGPQFIKVNCGGLKRDLYLGKPSLLMFKNSSSDFEIAR